MKQVKGLGAVMAVLVMVAAVPTGITLVGAAREAMAPRAQVAPIEGSSWSVVTSKDGVLLVTTMRAFRNVRELQSVIEVAAVRARGTMLEAEDMDLGVIGAIVAAPSGDERARIRDALARAGGSRVKAAKLLGISRATFYRRPAERGIVPGV